MRPNTASANGLLANWQLQCAVRSLRAGGLVLHATEGVWGLAADPFNEQAVARLLVLKARPVRKGLIVIGAADDFFQPELDSLDRNTRAEVCATWPGATTWILPNRRFPYGVTGGRTQVAVRVPAHPQARALCLAFGGPLISTSANRSGRPAPNSALKARRSFRARVFPGQQDYILPGEVLEPGRPSRIRTLAGEILRG